MYGLVISQQWLFFGRETLRLDLEDYDVAFFSGTMGRVWLHCGGVTTEARENDRDLFTFTDGARLKMDLSTKIGDT